MLLYPWQRQNLLVQSEPARCASINNKNLGWGNAAKTLTPVEEFSPSAEVPLRPASALAQLGKVAAPRAGIGVWGFASRLTWISHLWAFAEPARGRNLRLRPEARRIVGRQKGNLTEQLGIALGLSVVSRMLREDRRDVTIGIVDAEAALSFGQVEGCSFQSLPNRSNRPDYFVFRRYLNSPQMEIFALECKGNSETIRPPTLAKAARQLLGVGVVTPNGPVPPPGFLTAASFKSDGIVVEVFDPEGDEIWNGPAAPRFAPRGSVDRGVQGEGVVDPARFRRVLLQTEEIALMLLSGRLFVDGEFFLPPVPPVRRETPLGDFEGSRMLLSLSPRTEAEVFFGVHSEVVDAILTEEDESIDEVRVNLADRLFKRSDEPELTEEEADGEARVVGSDGVMLQVRLIRHRT